MIVRRHRAGLDPLSRVSEDSPTLAASWLRGGEKLTTFQRLGHGAVSFAYLGAGALAAQGALLDLKEGTIFMGVLFGMVAAFFLFFYGKGFQNILRFKR